MRTAGAGRAAALVWVALALTGCAGRLDAEAGPAAPRTAEASGHSLRVGLNEWSILTAYSQVPAGRLSLVVTNAGATTHDLVVEGRAGRWETPELHPGQHVRLAVRAEPGESLHLWCDEPGHRMQGMQASLRVVGQP